jgi:glycosyltransferase involved in cell wall biosynthesis
VTRVAFVAPSLNGGGAERAAVTVLNALDPQVFERALYLFRREGPYLRDVDPSIELVGAQDDGRAARIRQLSSFVARWRPQIVVSFLSYFSVFTALALARSKARFVINQQTPLSAFLTDRDYAWRQPLRRRLFEAVARAVYPRAAIVATSKEVGEDLIARFGVPRDAVTTIPNPADLAAIARASSEASALAVPADVPLVVAAGRLAHAKNWPLFVDALALLRRELPVQALILGEGESESDIRRRIAAAGLERAVHLCGFQSNPWTVMAKADVFLLTSRYEGFGNVLIEAMASGAPVVATASPGTRAIVRDEVNGLLVDRHEPAAVADAVGRVLRDKSLRERLRAGARESVRQFDVPVVAQAYTTLFQRLAA